MRIQIGPFRGMRPAVEPHLLEPGEAQLALDTLIERGSLEGLPQPELLRNTTKPTVDTIWRLPGPNEQSYWLEFSGRANVIRSPVLNDIWDRIYWTDSTGARYAPSSLALSGPSFPGGSYSLGVPTPTNAPSVSAAPVTDFSQIESRAYVETFVTQFGEEGTNGPASPAIDVDPRLPVSISSLSPIPSPPAGKNWILTARRIYRTSFTGGLAAAFQLVTELPISQQSYVDTVSQSNLGRVLDTDGFDPPPDGAYGMTVTESGMVVLLKDRQVYFSQNYLPHAYDLEQAKSLQFKAVAVASFEQTLVVMTEGDLYVGAGSTPSGAQLMRLASSQPCLSAAGVVVTRGGAYYPSPIGMIAVSNDLRPVNITQGMLTQKQWLDYNPASFKCVLQNGRIHCYFVRQDETRGILILDPSGQSAPLVEGMQLPGQAVRAVYRDPSSDLTYLVQATDILRVPRTGIGRPWTWRSGEFRFRRPTMLSAAIVFGEGGPFVFRAYGNRQEVFTKSVSSQRAFRLPSGRRHQEWSFEVQAPAGSKVTELRIAPSIEELFD
jgi:hypothetical protein